MNKIYKYVINDFDNTITMPEGAIPLKIGVSHEEGIRDEIVIWAFVDSDAPEQTTTLFVAGTGDPLPNWVKAGHFFDTVRLGTHIFHVFLSEELATNRGARI